MRILIDGYNLMHAAGRLNGKLGPDGLRKVRHRFLNELASLLDPVDAHQTAIVFDAAAAPEHLAPRQRHKGIEVIFAVGEPTADEMLENLIKAHLEPKRLHVVSSDNRVRLAATKRRARVSSSDEFLTYLDRLKQRATRERSRSDSDDPPESAPPLERPASVSEAESAFWLEEFADLVDSPEVREISAPPQLLSDDEIRRIEREVARESGPGDWSPSKGRRKPK
ncbi:MAG: NYN domain-containing protein [Isosphaeraceae bacterium]|nr:NYN domain-containing protein [Isosphaeraceae bacterium]